jgi:hypothetical protein
VLFVVEIVTEAAGSGRSRCDLDGLERTTGGCAGCVPSATNRNEL